MDCEDPGEFVYRLPAIHKKRLPANVVLVPAFLNTFGLWPFVCWPNFDESTLAR